MYGIKPPVDASEAQAQSGGEEEDIEASIQKELDAIKASRKPTQRSVFSPVAVAIECVFFMKTMKPVDPHRLVLRMCRDAQQCPGPRDRKCRYINRLTPVMDTDKATEKGIRRVARRVLAAFFSLNADDDDEEEDKLAAHGPDEKAARVAEPVVEAQQAEASPACTVSFWLRLRGTFSSSFSEMIATDASKRAVRYPTHHEKSHHAQIRSRHQDDRRHGQARAQSQPQNARQGHPRRDIPGTSCLLSA